MSLLFPVFYFPLLRVYVVQFAFLDGPLNLLCVCSHPSGSDFFKHRQFVVLDVFAVVLCKPIQEHGSVFCSERNQSSVPARLSSARSGNTLFDQVAAMNLLAFAFHTVCDTIEQLWIRVR